MADVVLRAVVGSAVAGVLSVIGTVAGSDDRQNSVSTNEQDSMTVESQLALARALDEAQASTASPWDYVRGARCGTGESTGDALAVGCVGARPECEDGAAPLAPLFGRPRDSTSENDWVQLGGWVCPQDAVPAFTATDLRELQIVSGVAGLNPEAGPLLVNAPNVLFTDGAEQTFAPVLLGYQFEVVVTPTSFAWDFGDGSPPLVTETAGHAFEPGDGDDLDGYLTHVYSQPGAHAITLTTTWSGRWRVPGRTDWADVLGTATTTATSRTFDVVERRSTLVAATCDEDPDAPGCG